MSVLIKIPKINSGCFIFENYESNWWNLLDLDFEKSMNTLMVMEKVKKYAVGYCESSQVLIRPRSDSYSVMFEKDGGRFWFHIPKWEIEF